MLYIVQNLQKSPFVLVLIILILVSACTQPPVKRSTPQPSTFSKISATAVKSGVPSFVQAPQETITPTITLERMSTATFTPSGILMNTATQTFTSVPTLAPDMAFTQLANLLQNNGGCKLPCLLGLTPGQSTIEDYKTFVNPYAAITEFSGNGPIPDFGHKFYGSGTDIEYNQGITNSLTIAATSRIDQNTIEMLILSTMAYKIIEDSNEYAVENAFGAESYRQLFTVYSLSHILFDYGIPENILVNVHFYTYDGRRPLPSQQFGAFRIRLAYPEQGIYVDYEMPLIKVGELGDGCPADAFVHLSLISPRDEEFYKMFIQHDQDFDSAKSIEDAASMSIEEFYHAFRNPSRKCIRTPLSIWPNPSELVPEK